MTANYKSGISVFRAWRDLLYSGEVPVRYPVGDGALQQMHIGPGRVTLLGGAPGAGKTAFVIQLMADALRLTESLRICVCNVEVSPATLLDRQLARLSGVPATRIQNRTLLPSDAERIEVGMNTLEAIVDRIAFVEPPYDLGNVAASADDFAADIVVLDYIQRIRVKAGTDGGKQSVDQTMDFIRQFADAGKAVIVVSAVGRSKDKSGRSSYSGNDLGLASFRESSELEFGADDAYILTPSSDTDDVVLRHLKARHSEPVDITMAFDRSVQSFSTEDAFAWKPDTAVADLADIWDAKEPASDD